MATSALKPGDAFRPELLRLLRTALHVMEQHVNREGRCAACASPAVPPGGAGRVRAGSPLSRQS